jgi:hypothetical protein
VGSARTKMSPDGVHAGRQGTVDGSFESVLLACGLGGVTVGSGGFLVPVRGQPVAGGLRVLVPGLTERVVEGFASAAACS